MSLEEKTTTILGPAGLLAREWPEFEYREGQLEAARAVARSLEGRGRAVIEAGAGTGKTLAYLVPAILSGQKATISTATKTLQEQVFFKDIPFLAARLGLKVNACLVKGRLNYLCLRRFHNALGQDRLDPYLGKKLQAWISVSQTGDRAEVDFLAEEDPLWATLTTSSDGCLGADCPHFSECYVTRLRRRAGQAMLIVVNHHLFAADLALRQGGFGQVLPESEAVVFDEAHELEEAATAHFTAAVSDLRLIDFLNDLAQAAPANQAGLLNRLAGAVKDLYSTLARPAERYPLDDEVLNAEAMERGKRLQSLLIQAGAAVADESADGDEAVSLAKRAEELNDQLSLILGRLEPDYVYYAERLKRGLSLKAAPIEVAGLLGRLLFNQPRAFIFTSATLDPPLFRARLDLNGPAEELVFASPYDFANQSLLYVPDRMAPPPSPRFPEEAADQMEALVNITRGRAFLLFTSNRNLDAVHRLLAPRLPWPVLKQGQAPKAKLIEDFLSLEGSVLMATASFWQGVDIPGPALSLVVIDKLPFAPPEDPLVAARLERLHSLGREPFVEYQLPEAALSLRQGLGRLIRSSSDSGVLAILDVRLLKKGYGKKILETLPKSPLVHDLEKVAAWAKERL